MQSSQLTFEFVQDLNVKETKKTKKESKIDDSLILKEGDYEIKLFIKEFKSLVKYGGDKIQTTGFNYDYSYKLPQGTYKNNTKSEPAFISKEFALKFAYWKILSELRKLPVNSISDKFIIQIEVAREELINESNV